MQYTFHNPTIGMEKRNYSVSTVGAMRNEILVLFKDSKHSHELGEYD